MKKLTSLFTTLLLTFLIFSCSKGEDISPEPGKFINNISLSKQSVFVNEELTLSFETNNAEITSVTSDKSDIIITPTSSTSYKITSAKVATGKITITTIRGEVFEKDEVQVIFNAHGTTDYQIIEGLDPGVSTKYTAIWLYGAPEGEKIFTTTTTNATTGAVTNTKYLTWYYFSKGISITIVDGTSLISNLTVYGTSWSAEIDGQVKQGAAYPHTIGTLGNFTTGILMDNIVTKFLVPAAADKLTSTIDPNIIGYKYLDINTTLTGNQTVIFGFKTDLKDVYQGKFVNEIVFY